MPRPISSYIWLLIAPKVTIFSATMVALWVIPSHSASATISNGDTRVVDGKTADYAGDLLLASNSGGGRSNLGDSSFASDSPVEAFDAPVAMESLEEVPLSRNERLAGASIFVQRFAFDTLHLTVDTGSTTPSVLYYSDTWHPQWRATVNGISTPVLKANLAYKAVTLPPGESKVIFRFGNWRSRLLLQTTVLLGFLAVGGVLYLLVTDLLVGSRPEPAGEDANG